MSSPKIIFDIKAHQYYSSYDMNNPIQKEASFFHCQQKFDALAYHSRAGAVEKDTLETVELIQSLSDNTNMKDEDIIGYAKDRPGSTGLWNSTGDVHTRAALKSLREEMRCTHSTVWSSVLSFVPEYACDHCKNKAEAQKVVSETLPGFFKDAGIDPTNVSWYGAYHVNTAHPHCHIVFWEKEPTTMDSKGNLSHHDWKLQTKALRNFPIRIQAYLDEKKMDTYELRDHIRTTLHNGLQSNVYIKEILELSNNFSQQMTFQYARLSNFARQKLINTVNNIIQSNKELRTKDANYRKSLMDTQKRYVQYYLDNHQAVPEETKKYASTRTADYYSRLGNEVLHTLEDFKKHFTTQQAKDLQKELTSQETVNRNKILFTKGNEIETDKRKFYGQSRSRIRTSSRQLDKLKSELNGSILKLIASMNEAEAEQIKMIRRLDMDEENESEENEYEKKNQFKQE